MGIKKIKKIRPPYKPSPEKGGRGRKEVEDEELHSTKNGRYPPSAAKDISCREGNYHSKGNLRSP